MTLHRRRFLQGLAGASLALPLARLFGPEARALTDSQTAQRVIFMFFPDGVPAESQNGDPSLWHPTGSETSFQLPAVLQPLAPFKDRCVFFRGLSLGPTDNGNHPGGAKKLLTAVDYGNGQSIDQFLAQTVGADRPFRHVYLGAMANQNNASGDKHISYPSPGTSTSPQDNPLLAFESLFGAAPGGSGGSGGSGNAGDDRALRDTASVIDASLADLNDLRGALDTVDQPKLDLHLESLREIEARVQGLLDGTGGTNPGGASCESPAVDTGSISGENLYDPAMFPQILRAQTDIMVLAMACGLTRVGVLQASHHTSELIMSRFPGTDMYDPGFDMRSHQASHYGDSHDPNKREFSDFVAQRRWFVEQYAYLLESLAARPEGDGTMLDHSIVVLCSEVSDGNTHSHDNMPFILAGGAGGCISTGRLLQYSYHRHADLLVAIARAMGSSIQQFGQASSGPLPGLLS